MDMFSKLDPISVPGAPRKTESSDARMELRRDESHADDRRKNRQEDDRYTPIPWEDSAVVSTTGLKVFLQSLLQGALPSSSAIPKPAPTEEPHTPPPQPPAPIDDRMSRAAHAYQTMGKAVHDRNVEETPPLPVPASQASETVTLGTDFTEEDLKDLRLFIADLTELERRGVAQIPIERSLSFLEGVRRAIAAALQQ